MTMTIAERAEDLLIAEKELFEMLQEDYRACLEAFDPNDPERVDGEDLCSVITALYETASIIRDLMTEIEE